MNKDDGIMAIFFIASLTGAGLFALWVMTQVEGMSNEAPRTKLTVQYDCRIAEISVDYPQQVKEQCRKLLMPNISYGEK